MKTAAAAVLGISIVTASIGSLAYVLPRHAHAAVADWQQGASIVPTTTTDFGTDAFKQSLRNLRDTGASAVALVVPYYQSDEWSTDVQSGWNTPTDSALISAINYAHTLGFSVTLKVHVEPYTGAWRAYINPSDRGAWFASYGARVMNVARIAEDHDAELIVLGTELVSMASSAVNSTNTQHWLDLIAQVRSAYGGKLTYGANSNSNNDDPFLDEKSSIGFWSALDYVGLSTYYNLNTSDNSVESLAAQWDYWNRHDLEEIARQTGKPLLVTELGYRSVDGAHKEPWNWQMGGAYNAAEQANAYEAFMSYWNSYPYMTGVYWWDWKSDPNAGGQGNTDYTPQRKPAQDVLTRWFTNPPSPSSGAPTFEASVHINPSSPAQGALATISATVRNDGGALSNGIVDIEIYDQAGTKVFQKFFSGQNIASGATVQYSAEWTAGPPGAYRIAVGIFSANWTQNYSWIDRAGQVTVGTSQTPPPTGGTLTTEIWWPTSGTPVSGVQPFKAMVQGRSISEYQMFWQVDSGQLNPMHDSQQDYPHKEALVDLSAWRWNASRQYRLNFVSKNASGAVISQKSVLITVNN